MAVNKDQSLTFSHLYSKEKSILSSSDQLSNLGDLNLDQEIKYKITN